MTTDTWAVLVGFALPALVAVVNRSEWKPWLKGLVVVLASVVVGTVTALLAGQFTGANWVQSMGIVFASSQLAYHTWWKGTGIADKIEQGVNVISGKSASAEDGTPGDSGGASE